MQTCCCDAPNGSTDPKASDAAACLNVNYFAYPLPLAQTIAMNMLVVLQIFYLFFIRNIHGTSLTWAAAKGTRVVWISVVTVTLAQFAVTYAPPLQAIFGTAPVPLLDGMLIIAIGVLLSNLSALLKTYKLDAQQRCVGSSLPGSIRVWVLTFRFCGSSLGLFPRSAWFAGQVSISKRGHSNVQFSFDPH